MRVLNRKPVTRSAARLAVVPLLAAAMAISGAASAAARPNTATPAPGKIFNSLADAYDNTAVSDDGARGQGNADGNGYTISRQELAAAGWNGGQAITVNGAQLTLPRFGGGRPDNVRAAHQTISMHNATGRSLVFLTSGTNANSDAYNLVESATTPHVSEGAPVVGARCLVRDGQPVDCRSPLGTVTYADGSKSDYQLDVPDWTSGPSDIAALTLAHRNRPDGSREDGKPGPRLYAFAVPVKPGVPIASVTLPDVYAPAIAAETAPAVPAVHIFGLTTRDTTAAPGGKAWTGAWTSPANAQRGLSGGTWRDETVRLALRPSIGGEAARVRLDNPFGARPVRLSHATIAPQGHDATPSAPPASLSFAGHQSTVIPAGGQVYSDPLPLKVTAGQNLLISESVIGHHDTLPTHDQAQAVEFATPPGSGDHTADTTGAAFVPHCRCSTLAAALDVVAPGQPGTVAFLGGSRANGSGSGLAKGIDNDLAAILNKPGANPGWGVVNAAADAGHLAPDGAGTSGLSRLDRDVLTQPNLRAVVVWPDAADLAAGDSALEDSGLIPLIPGLVSNGVNVILATVTPCHGAAICPTAVDDTRVAVNTWLRKVAASAAPRTPSADGRISTVDLNAVVAAPAADDPKRQVLQTGPGHDFDRGDHVNLTDDAYLALAQHIDPGRI